MDFTKEEANIVYEDRVMDLDSSGHLEGSDDEENQQELEEMLYSRVYFDSTCIGDNLSEESSSPIISVNVTTIGVETKVGFASAGLNESDSNSKGAHFQSGCARSEFNHPARTSVSRYYDVNQDKSNANPIFVAPRSPSEKRNVKSLAKKRVNYAPSPLTTKILARSANEQLYLPNASKKDNAASNRTIEAEPENNLPGNSSSLAEQNAPRDVDVSSEGGQKNNKLDTVTDKQSSAVPVETASNPAENNSAAAKVAEDKQQKKICQSTPVSTKKSKLPSFESKVSKVLSSMLDEESRSSMEENQSNSLCGSQNLMSESGWTVGMSWADMSSKFSFEVDSIEEESVSSIQLQESSFTAESFTNTTDIPTRLGNRNDIDDEPSRYQLILQAKAKESESMQSDCCDIDSESEVGSVVEVAPPVKPSPPLVDISDGEYTPLNNSKSTIQTIANNEVTVLLSKQKESTALTDNIIDISSDDDLMILEVLDPSQPKNLSAQKEQERHSPRIEARLNSEGPKRRSARIKARLNFEESIPPKRLSYQKEQNSELPKMDEDLQNQGRVLLNEPLVETSFKRKMSKIDRWLHNPIKAFKYLDHEKDLKKMNDDPSLWQLCWADKTQIQSPRGPKCINCNQFGHKVHACRAPRKMVVCHMCGTPGHTETRCKQKMCLKCGVKNNIYTDQCKNCVNNATVCKICNSRAHAWKTCPDLWRRYHLTTSYGVITKPIGVDIRPKCEQWCSNCAGKGHLSHDCRKSVWKCESISPFIKSYAAVAAEEEKCDGIESYAMMLSSEAARFLGSSEGKEFLKHLSSDCKVAIHASLDITFKKLHVEGPSVVLEEVRCKIRDWIQAQTVHKILPKDMSAAQSVKTGAHKELSGAKTCKVAPPGTKTQNKVLSDGNPLKGVSPTTAAETQAEVTIRSPWDLPPTLPKNHAKLADILDKELKIIDSPVPCNLTVKQLHETLLELNVGRATNSKKRNMRRYARVLSIILLGQCGLQDGIKHVVALKKLLPRLQSRKGDINRLYNMVVRHFLPIFAGIMRPDFEDLVKQFYSSKTFVESFDCKNAQDDTGQSVVTESQALRHQKSPCTGEQSKEGPLSTPTLEESSTPKTQKKPTKDASGNTIIQLYQNNGLISDAVEKKVKQDVPTVIKNLSSRFIFSKDRAYLERMYKALCKNRFKGTNKQGILLDMKKVIDKLCRSYNIELH